MRCQTPQHEQPEDAVAIAWDPAREEAKGLVFLLCDACKEIAREHGWYVQYLKGHAMPVQG